jgi:cell division protein ZapA
MPSTTTQVSVRILDKEYQFACHEDERAALLRSADHLDRMMREIRAGGRVVGLDRIAVMAALNMANELLAQRESEEDVAETAVGRVRALHDRLLDVLETKDGTRS